MEEAGSDDEEFRRRTYASERAELLKRQSANADAYDRAVLTLSGGVLALSLSFIKDILPIGSIGWMGVLYASWVFLTLAALITVISFQVSNSALTREMEQIRRYYLEKDDSALRRTALALWVDRLNIASGVAFVGGVILTVTFVFLNFSEARYVTTKTSGEAVTRLVNGGNEQRGQPVQQIQPLTKPATSAPTQAPAQPAAKK